MVSKYALYTIYSNIIEENQPFLCRKSLKMLKFLIVFERKVGLNQYKYCQNVHQKALKCELYGQINHNPQETAKNKWSKLHSIIIELTRKSC